jgi:hypothetical protein
MASLSPEYSCYKSQKFKHFCSLRCLGTDTPREEQMIDEFHSLDVMGYSC